MRLFAPGSRVFLQVFIPTTGIVLLFLEISSVQASGGLGAVAAFGGLGSFLMLMLLRGYRPVVGFVIHI